jgi:hypothetical protein
LGAVVAQAAAAKVMHKAARRGRAKKERVWRVIAESYTAFAVFWRKTAISSPIWRVDRGGGLA